VLKAHRVNVEQTWTGTSSHRVKHGGAVLVRCKRACRFSDAARTYVTYARHEAGFESPGRRKLTTLDHWNDDRLRPGRIRTRRRGILAAAVDLFVLRAYYDSRTRSDGSLCSNFASTGDIPSAAAA
jgi:hypothetical protein